MYELTQLYLHVHVCLYPCIIIIIILWGVHLYDAYTCTAHGYSSHGYVTVGRGTCKYPLCTGTGTWVFGGWGETNVTNGVPARISSRFSWVLWFGKGL